MKRSIVSAATALVLAAVASAATIAFAQGYQATQHVLSRGQVARPSARPDGALRRGNHVVFGRLESVKGQLLTLRTRSGRLWNVDATAALQSGNYSAPLFVGKIVEVDCYLNRSNVLEASGIMRMASLDRGTPGDR